MPDNLSSFSGYSSTDEVLLLLKLKKKERSRKPHFESCHADHDYKPWSNNVSVSFFAYMSNNKEQNQFWGH